MEDNCSGGTSGNPVPKLEVPGFENLINVRCKQRDKQLLFMIIWK
jgi:hypothetical protein